MKNFFKKLSFVLASAMVITSLYAPANTSAAAKDGIILKGKAVTKKGIFVGGEKVNFDYKIGKHNNKGANGKWSVSDTSVITVDKHGKVTAVGTGSATLYLKVKKNAKKGIKKNLTFKVKINAMARADKLTIPASDKAITLKVGEMKDIMPVLTDKVEGVKNTYNLFARTDNPTDVAVVVKDNAKVVVTANNPTATSATITVFAAQKSNEDDAFNNKYKVEDTFMVDVKPNLEAMQTAANKITVKGMDLVATPSAYVIKTDKGVVINVKSVSLNDAKTEATLEGFVSQFAEGKYTLTYREDAKAEFDVAKVVVKEIKLMPEDKAIMKGSTGADSQKATANFKVFDQFGNDITNTDFPKLNVVGTFYKAAESDLKKGILAFESNAAFIPNISKINVSVVDINTGVNVAAVLTVSSESMLWAVEYKGLYDTDKKKMIETNSISESADLSKVTLLFEAKNQYGAILDAPNTSNALNVLLVTTTGLKAKALGAGDIADLGVKKYVQVGLEKLSADYGVMSGSVTVQAIVKNNGAQASGKFEVTPAKKVNTLNVLDGVVYSKQENVLAYEALDLDGKPVTDFALLQVLNKTEYITSYPDVKFVNEKGKAVLKYTPNLDVPDGVEQTVPLSFRTSTNKFDTAMITVKAIRYPKSIIAVDSKDLIVGATRNGKIEIKYDKLKFQDQFGGEMSFKEVIDYNKTIDAAIAAAGTDEAKKKALRKKSIGLKAELVDAGKYFVLSDNTAVFKVNDTNKDHKVTATSSADNNNDVTAGKSFSNKIKFVLVTNENENDTDFTQSKNVSELGFEIHNVTLNDMSNFTVEKNNLYPADGVTDAKKGVLPKVVGMYNGHKISLQPGADFEVLNGVDEDGGNGNKNHVLAPKKTDMETAKETKKVVKFTVIISNTAGTTVDNEYTFSVEDRKLAKAELKDAGVLHTTDTANAKGWADIKASFNFKDQYDADIEVNTVYLTFANIKDLTVENNSKTDTTVKYAAGVTIPPVSKVRFVEPVSGYVFEAEVTVEN